MAFKSVVVDCFFTDLIPALTHIEQRHDLFALAMLVPSFPNRRNWDLHVSAHWLDCIGSNKQARRALKAEIEVELGAAFARLGFLQVQNLDSLMVQTLVPVFDVEEFGTAYAFTYLEQTIYELDEVIVLVARPALLLRPQMRLTA